MAEAAVTTRLKKLINTPESEVKDAMAGMAAAHGDLIRVEYDPNVIIRKDAPRKGKVGLVSGGGSGHEPLHGGYVGLGMLDAACPGAVFTSPTPDQMARATAAVDGGAGVLHVVKNYTGDIMNFEMAAELARGEGAKVNAVITNDDVAVQDSLYTAGRRGVGVTVFVEKIAGACAEAGADLDTVTALAKKVNANGRSMGMALTSCIVPAAGKVTFEIADDEMELGIGIHGEPGRERTKLKSADEIAEILTMAVVNDIPYKSGDEVLAMVNGMGGTPLIELYVVFNAVNRYLAGKGIKVTRSLVGNYITSLEMAGTSVTLLKLDAELTKFWDAPVHTPALRWKV
jgi:phosphoenolpyruvate---glycerone phosphotransferase subunit DhaK